MRFRNRAILLTAILAVAIGPPALGSGGAPAGQAPETEALPEGLPDGSPRRTAAIAAKVTAAGASFRSRRRMSGSNFVKLQDMGNGPQMRFADLAARVAHRQQLDALVESWTIQHTPHQVMLILQRDGIAAGVVQTAQDLYRDPHLRERGFARDVYLPQVGWATRAGPSVRMTETPFVAKEEVHRAGEDNEAVFGEVLGISKAKISEMAEQGVLR